MSKKIHHVGISIGIVVVMCIGIGMWIDTGLHTPEERHEFWAVVF